MKLQFLNIFIIKDGENIITDLFSKWTDSINTWIFIIVIRLTQKEIFRTTWHGVYVLLCFTLLLAYKDFQIQNNTLDDRITPWNV